MLIQHMNKENKGVFFIPGEEDEPLAELIYMKQGDHTLIVEHTEVSEVLQGQNIGFQLVNAVVDYARQQGFTIIPMCYFAKSVIDKKPEFQDVLEDQ
jgi:uncharacterized protein